jgi:hypothetical protein
LTVGRCLEVSLFSKCRERESKQVVVVDSWLLFRGLVVSSGLTVYFKQVKLTWQNGYPDGENCRELLQKIGHFYHITDKQGPFCNILFSSFKSVLFSLLARTEKKQRKRITSVSQA